MSTIETITLNPLIDAHVNEAAPTLNYGITNISNAGSVGVSTKRNAFGKYDIPNYNGVIKSVKLRIYITSITAQQTLGIHLMDSPYDDLWIEGTSNGGADAEGCSWNDYVRLANWKTPGGDYGNTPIGIIVRQGADPVNQYYDIDIPVDNFTPQPDETQTLVLTCPDDTISGVISWHARNNTNKPELVIELEIDDYTDPEIITTPVSSTEILLEWDEVDIAEENFVHYLIEQSDTGVGGWTTLATITEKDTISYAHTGLVVQGDVDDYDEDSDTYPNGRTKYYRIKVSTSWGDNAWSSVASETTIPAVRPVQFTFEQKSKYYADDFVDDNVGLIPYGVNIIPAWYDDDDTTPESQIDKITAEIFYKPTGVGWGGVADETVDATLDDFDTGVLAEGDTGYRPYKIKGKIYDIGGLYRKATTDKTTEQFDITWPAPAPVAVPFGTGWTPPDLDGPYTSGDLVPIDLELFGQQDGGNLYVEDFTGVNVGDDDGKWIKYRTGGSAPNFVYTTFGGNPCIEYQKVNDLAQTAHIHKRLKDEGVTNDENRYMNKYTGAYRVRVVGRAKPKTPGKDSYNFYLNIDAFSDAVSSPSTYDKGYMLYMISNLPNLYLSRRGNLVSDVSALLIDPLNAGLAHPTYDHPWYASHNTGDYFLLDVIVSPTFDGTKEGCTIFLIYNIASTLHGVYTYNLDTHPYVWVIQDTGHSLSDQDHYTGRVTIRNTGGFGTGDVVTGAFQYFDVSIIGKHTDLSAANGEGYGAKNLLTGRVFGLSDTPITMTPIFCEPDQASQTVYVEGRVKNEYGAQSRTKEIDDYQGDVFTNALPTAVLIAPTIGYVDQRVVFNGSLSSDPEGGDLVYEWDWDDGSLVETTNNAINSHVFTSTGTYDVELRVQDEIGNWSTVDTKTVTIITGDFDIFSFICPEPFTDISLIREDGDTETPVPGYALSYYQNNKTGGRKFNISGFTVECSNLSDTILIANAQAEIDLLDTYYKEGIPITLQLPVHGDVKGFITAFRPKVNDANPRFWTWTMTFKELSEEQAGG